MSNIYKKKITTTIVIDYIKCDKCLKETQLACAIDCWCIINGDNYCLDCQKKYKVGFYKKVK